MNKQNLELARRAVACVPAGHWPEGTRLFGPFGTLGQPCRIWNVEDDKVQLEAGAASSWYRKDGLGDFLPDLSDPATIGCLLHLVREAWGDPLAWVECTNRFFAYDDRGTGCGARAWVVHINTPPHPTRIPADTDIEALVTALEAADE